MHVKEMNLYKKENVELDFMIVVFGIGRQEDRMDGGGGHIRGMLSYFISRPWLCLSW